MKRRKMINIDNEEYVYYEDETNNDMNVKNIIEMIKEIDVDGETMQYILEETGLDYQMYKQLNVKYNYERK
jgi:CRISPR/Cas system CMR-associated protein Cmr5 small subunit